MLYSPTVTSAEEEIRLTLFHGLSLNPAKPSKLALKPLLTETTVVDKMIVRRALERGIGCTRNSRTASNGPIWSQGKPVINGRSGGRFRVRRESDLAPLITIHVAIPWETLESSRLTISEQRTGPLGSTQQCLDR